MLGERRRLFHIHGTLLLTFGFSFHHLTTQTLAIPQSNVTAAWLNNIVSTRCKWKGLERMNVPDHDSLPLAECELEFPHHRYTIHRLGPFRFESTVGRMQNRGLYNLTHHRGYEATWLFRKGRTSIVGAGAWAVDAANPERILGASRLYYHHIHLYWAEDEARLATPFVIPGQQGCSHRLRQQPLLHGDSQLTTGMAASAYTDWLPFSFSSS